jgi:predicted nucleotidyltransferase component of viral defense system
MIQLRPQDAIHKSYLNRILIEIADSPILSQTTQFKGGTCAAMLGYLDRFSVDLDFDIVKTADEKILNNEFTHIVKNLGLEIITKAPTTLFYQLKYHGKPEGRNSLKVSFIKPEIDSNDYKVRHFPEINRLLNSQTVESMFANKLVAVMDRYQKHSTVAGRDVYDIHHYFTSGYSFKPEIIKDRTGKEPAEYLRELEKFIRLNISETIINEDLNTLLPPGKFREIRKILLPETLHFLQSV